jgi:hypothetical protein
MVSFMPLLQGDWLARRSWVLLDGLHSSLKAQNIAQTHPMDVLNGTRPVLRKHAPSVLQWRSCWTAFMCILLSNMPAQLCCARIPLKH